MLFANILLIIFVTLWTIFIFYVPYLLGAMDDIKNNWPAYRCSPMILPIAGYINKQDNQTENEATSENFTYCTQNILTNFMGYLLEPLNYLTSGLTDLGSDLVTNLSSIRGIIDSIRSAVSFIVEGIYGMVVNIIIQFIKIFNLLRDALSRLLGAFMVFYYIISGAVITVESGGKSLETLMSNPWNAVFCFHPDTILKKKNGELCKMSDVALGDILDGNSEVIIILKIKNNSNNQLYKLINTNNNGEIIVSGSHLIYSKNGYIEVKNHPEAIKTDVYHNELYCLITSNQKIKIGKYYFHDWEDDVEREKLKNYAI
jgi:hypothetical protein